MQIVHNPFVYFLFFAASSGVAHVLNSQPNSLFTFKFIFAILFYFIFLDITFVTVKEKYTPKRFIISIILLCDFLYKFIKSAKLFFIGYILFIIVMDISRNFLLDLNKLDAKNVHILYNFCLQIYIVPLLILINDRNLRMISDDYYSYFYEGALKKERAEAYSPSSIVNRDFLRTFKLLFIMTSFLTVFINSILLYDIIILIFMSQYTMEAYGDDGLRKKKEQEDKSKINISMMNLS